MTGISELITSRLRLRSWRDEHRDAFAKMHADPEVMADLGGPIERVDSDAKFDRYVESHRMHQTSRWAVEARDGAFLGYAGVMARPDANHPLGSHHEVGWRFNRAAWGLGYATESARAALEHAVRMTKLANIVSYTGKANHRSQSVMRRLGLHRQPGLDFTVSLEAGRSFHALVWDVYTADYL